MEREEAAELIESWETGLRAERKSPHTIKTYLAGMRAYLKWWDAGPAQAGPVFLSRASVQAFTAALIDGGAEAATALSRQRGVRRFSAWCAAEDITAADELAHMKPPKLDDKMPAEVTTQQIQALLATCKGREFHDLRDAAIVRIMVESMVRSDELLSMTVDGVNIRGGVARVERGKGGRGRIVAFGPQTARALDRYARARRKHPLATSSDHFWLAARARVMGYGALYITLRRRAERAGFRLHPHVLRSTGAIRWREKGGSVPSLLTLAGWSSVEMAQRYVRAAENRLAVEEAHRLLGDDL